MFIRGRTLSRVRIDMKRRHRNHHIVAGFTLPTIMIVSIVMFAVLATSVQFVSQSSSSLRDTYYDQLAREAAESGLLRARSCSSAWAQPLRSGSDCNGASAQCTSAGCFIVDTGSVRSAFSVAPPAVGPNDAKVVVSTGTVEQKRTDGTWYQVASYSGKMQYGSSASSVPTSWKSITTGQDHTCAISSDNQAYCWGKLVGDGTTTGSRVPKPVTTTGALSGKTVTMISAGWHDTCALASDGWVYCWGNGWALGNSSYGESYVPIPVTSPTGFSGKTFTRVSVGLWRHACATSSDNALYCWGDSTFGQTGPPAQPGIRTPTKINNGAMPTGVIKALSTGWSSACAIASNDKVYCWGDGSYGNLGNGGVTSTYLPMAVSTSGGLFGRTITAVSASSHTCVTTDTDSYCWSTNNYGQLGNGSEIDADVPVAVRTNSIYSPGLMSNRLVSVAAGDSHTCGIAVNNLAYCWGDNAYGQLGRDTYIYAYSPDLIITLPIAKNSLPVIVPTEGVLSGKTFKQISAGGSHTCAIASDDQIYCWGRNNFGQLGDGTITNSSTPKKIAPAVVGVGAPLPTIIY